MMRLFKEPAGPALPLGKDMNQKHIIEARAGWDMGVASAGLPVSTFTSSTPDSPNQAVSLQPNSSQSSTPSSRGSGHIVAERCAFEDVNLDAPVQNGALNGKLSQLLEKRKAKEAEAIRAVKAEHACEIDRKDDLHRDELNMKDAAHRRTVDHMEAEMNALRLKLQTALNRCDKTEEENRRLQAELDVEHKLRRAAEEEQQSLHQLLEAELVEL